MTARPYSVAGLADEDVEAIIRGPGQRQNRISRTCYLYFVTMEHFPLVKIGRSGDVRKRLAHLQNASPFLLSVEASFLIERRFNFNATEQVLPGLSGFFSYRIEVQ